MDWTLDLLRSAKFDHEVFDLQLIETHISVVILAGPFVYKIKKPVNLGFLDYGELSKRKFFCDEELRLNRRLAPDLYLDVVGICQRNQTVEFGGTGAPFEYAVRMRRFDGRNLVSESLRRNQVTRDHVDTLARFVSQFHAQASHAGLESDYGLPEKVLAPVTQCIDQIESGAIDLDLEGQARLTNLKQWVARQVEIRHDDILKRRESGRVRECHGDMHAGNMVLEHGKILIFDGIEFNPSLRWIDVISEVAFVTMDFEDRGHIELARRFLNEYLEAGGDYQGLNLLPFYSAYRALVRANVTGIRAHQAGLSSVERSALEEEIVGYLGLAQTYTLATSPSLLITHGFSGSGKSTRALEQVEKTGAIRVRSDVERKRLLADAPHHELYSSDANQKTYAHLLELSTTVLTAGRSVIIDATFLKRQNRDRFRDLANKLGVPFAILDCQADPDLLRRRLETRTNDASDATPTVLEEQLAQHDPLAADEIAFIVNN